jgi:hypothetical protein
VIARAIRFFKSPPGAMLLVLAGTFVFFYFVREHRERKAMAEAEAKSGEPNLERIGQMAPEAVRARADEAITAQWVEDNRLDKFTPPKAGTPQPPRAPAPPTKAQPRALPKIVHVFRSPDKPKVAKPEDPKPPRNYAPPGTLIPCQLIITVDSSSLATPVVGFVSEDVWHNGNLVIPAGTEVHSFAKRGRVRDRIEVHGEWKFVWQDGREVQVNGIGLDREFDPDEDTYGITDGSAGIRGRMVETDQFLEFKLFAATAVSGVARRSEETTETIFGSKPNNSLENAGLEGAAAVTDRYADLLLDQIEDDGTFVRVPAGTQFYVYTLQVFEPKLASVAGLVQGHRARNSWEEKPNRLERGVPATPDPTLAQTAESALQRREQLAALIKARQQRQQEETK